MEAPAGLDSIHKDSGECGLSVQTETKHSSVKMEIILSPATKSIPMTSSQPNSPSTQLDIKEKLNAAGSRKEMLEKLKVLSISHQLAKVEAAAQKRDEIAQEKCTKLADLQDKLEKADKKRSSSIQQTKEKVQDHLEKAEKIRKFNEIKSEANKISTKFSIMSKLNKAKNKRDEIIEDTVKKAKEHEEHVTEVLNNQMVSKIELEAKISEKMEKAAKEREKQEAELMNKLSERNKKAEVVKSNKKRVSLDNDTVPESA